MFSRNMYLYHLVSGVLFIGMGVFMLIKPPEAFIGMQIPAELVAGMLVAWGAFRLWRGWMGLKKLKQQE